MGAWGVCFLQTLIGNGMVFSGVSALLFGALLIRTTPVG